MFVFFLFKKPITKSPPFVKFSHFENEVSFWRLIHEVSWRSHSVCNTVYFKTMWFLKTETQFFERELFQNGYKQQLTLKEGDVNKGKCVHRTTLLLRWTKVLNGMFHEHLPLEINWDLQQWMRLWLNITQSWYVLFLIMDGLLFTAYTNFANTFLISFPSKNSDLSSMLETFRMIYS